MKARACRSGRIAILPRLPMDGKEVLQPERDAEAHNPEESEKARSKGPEVIETKQEKEGSHKGGEGESEGNRDSRTKGREDRGKCD